MKVALILTILAFLLQMAIFFIPGVDDKIAAVYGMVVLIAGAAGIIIYQHGRHKDT